MHCTNARSITKTAVLRYVINNPRDLLKMTGRVKKRGTSQFQNYSESKYGIFRTLYTHEQAQKLPYTCTHLTDIQYVLDKSHGKC